MNQHAEQLSLLSTVPASHRDDPSTSHQAERAVTESGSRATNQHRVLEGVRRHPGLTSKELAVRVGLNRYEVARRLGDLKNSQAFQGAPRPCTASYPSQRKAVTWWPSRAQAEASRTAEKGPRADGAARRMEEKSKPAAVGNPSR